MLVDLEAGKSTGPDGISLEALQAMMQDESWESRIRYMLDDFLYKGTLPPPVLAGVTVLLPKTAGPRQAWGGHTSHYAFLGHPQVAQLLLVRGGHQLQDGDIYQWARRGRQGTELLVILRRVMRMARDWGVPVWVVKLDIRKAFDSVWQESMGDLVARRVGRLLQGGGTALGGQAWEARLAGAAGGTGAPHIHGGRFHQHPAEQWVSRQPCAFCCHYSNSPG